MYSLIQDDSCHWYVIPSDKRKEALEYLDDPYTDLDWPEWLIPIDSPESIKFNSYVK